MTVIKVHGDLKLKLRVRGKLIKMHLNHTNKMYQDEESSSLEKGMVFVFKLCVLFLLSNFKKRKGKLPKNLQR